MPRKEITDGLRVTRGDGPPLWPGPPNPPPPPRACALWRAGVVPCAAAPGGGVLQVLPPTAVWAPGPEGLYVADFGANLAGVVQLRGLRCPAGVTVTLRHAEVLQHEALPDTPRPDPRRVYTANLRAARATDVYTCAGLAEGETWAPHFTYHGFRYVEVAVSDPGVAVEAGHLRLLHQHSAVDARAALWFPAQPTLNRLQARPFPLYLPHMAPKFVGLFLASVAIGSNARCERCWAAVCKLLFSCSARHFVPKVSGIFIVYTSQRLLQRGKAGIYLRWGGGGGAEGHRHSGVMNGPPTSHAALSIAPTPPQT